MRTLIYLLIVGAAILLSLKVLAALAALLLPLLIVGLVLAVPVVALVLLGWAVVAFLRGMRGDHAGAGA